MRASSSTHIYFKKVLNRKSIFTAGCAFGNFLKQKEKKNQERLKIKTRILKKLWHLQFRKASLGIIIIQKIFRNKNYDSTIVSVDDTAVLELFICLSLVSPFKPLLLSISKPVDDPLFLDDPLILRLVVFVVVTVLESHFDLGAICLLMVLKDISSSSEMEDDSDSSLAEDNGLISALSPLSSPLTTLGFSIPFWVQFEVQLLADLIGEENLLMILKARSPEAGEG